MKLLPLWSMVFQQPFLKGIISQHFINCSYNYIVTFSTNVRCTFTQHVVNRSHEKHNKRTKSESIYNPKNS